MLKNFLSCDIDIGVWHDLMTDKFFNFDSRASFEMISSIYFYFREKLSLLTRFTYSSLKLMFGTDRLEIGDIT